jgi:hypothetical protein
MYLEVKFNFRNISKNNIFDPRPFWLVKMDFKFGVFRKCQLYLSSYSLNTTGKTGKVPYLGPQKFCRPPLGPNFRVLGII